MAVMRIGGPGARTVEIVGDDGRVTRTTRKAGESLDLPTAKRVHEDALAGRAVPREVVVAERRTKAEREIRR